MSYWSIVNIIIGKIILIKFGLCPFKSMYIIYCWTGIWKLSCSAWENCRRYHWYNYWYKLIDFFKINEINNINSRSGSGRNKGGTTCIDSSTVNYVLYTTSVLKILQDFDSIISTIVNRTYSSLNVFFFFQIETSNPPLAVHMKIIQV